MITRDHPMLTTFALLESFPITVRSSFSEWGGHYGEELNTA
jgi:hypothetical protein